MYEHVSVRNLFKSVGLCGGPGRGRQCFQGRFVSASLGVLVCVCAQYKSTNSKVECVVLVFLLMPAVFFVRGLEVAVRIW